MLSKLLRAYSDLGIGIKIMAAMMLATALLSLVAAYAIYYTARADLIEQIYSQKEIVIRLKADYIRYVLSDPGRRAQVLADIAAGRPSRLLERIVGDYNGQGETGDFFLIDRSLRMVTHSRFVINDFFEQEDDSANARDAFKNANRTGVYAERSPQLIYRDYRGKMVLGSHAYIPEADLALIAKMDADEALAPLKRIQLVLLGVMLIVPLLAGILSYRLSAFLTRPVVRLKDAFEELGKGNFEVKVKVDSRDELGALADGFNEMASGLKLAAESEANALAARQTQEKNQELEKTLREVSESKRIMQSLMEDAMESKRAVEAARSTMESMVQSMAEGLVLSNEKGAVVIINPAARSLLGLKSDLKLPDELSRMTADILTGAAGLLSHEVALPANPGTVLRFDVEPVRGNRKEILGSVTIIRDITKAKEVDRMKTEFVSTVSHELRTPLSVIHGVITNFLDGVVGEFTKEQREYLLMADEDTKRLTALIDDLLDLSKLEAGRVDLRKAETDLNQLVDRGLREVKDRADEKKLCLVKEIPPGFPALNVDPDKIMQVVLNLLTNAVKFTGEGGRIAVLAGRNEAGQVTVSVVDNGIGLAKEDAAKLFNRFQQVGRTPGPGAKGTGLGLSICKEIVKLHKGNIWVESEPGKGSKFSFTLPTDRSDNHG